MANNYDMLLRKRYEGLANSVKGAGLSVEPSKLRIEEDFKSGVGQYRFDIKKVVSNLREKSLDRNDVFVPNFIGLFIGLRPTATPAAMQLFSFAPVNDGTNPSIFPAGFKKEDANALYNGQFTWTVDNIMVFSGYPTENFLKIPENQGKILLKASDDSVVKTGNRPEWAIKEMSELMIPRIIVAGTRDHRISVNFDAAGLDFSVTDQYDPVLVLYMDGYLIKNGCEFVNGSNAFKSVVGEW